MVYSPSFAGMRTKKLSIRVKRTMGDLRDKLIRAGFLSTELKKEFEKGSPKQRRLPPDGEKKKRSNQNSDNPSREGSAMHSRTLCEQCGKTTPDVECYHHSIRRLRGEWLCVACADEFCIDDKIRVTNGSQHARTGLFRRNYGRTKQFRS